MKKALSLLKIALKKIGNKEAENEVKDIINAVLNEADISELINSNNADWEDGEQAPSYLRKKAGMILAIKDWQDLEGKFGENAVKAKKIWEDFVAKDSSGKYNESIDSFIDFYRNKANLSGENSSTYKELKDLMKKPEVKNIEEKQKNIKETYKPSVNYSYNEESNDEMYNEILKGISAPITKNNIEFMRAWRKAEGGRALFNPFNTTQNWVNSSNYNSVGVKNYATKEDGIKATVKTLLNGRYNDIVDSLKNDNPPNVTAESKGLHTWGTGGGILRVLNSRVRRGLSNVGIEDLTPGTIEWLRLFQEAAERRGIPVTATSGRRDPRRQAAAMIAKVERGEDLYALYRDDKQVGDLMNGPRTVERWSAIIAEYAERGRGISNHLGGKAVDIRTRDWTPEQLKGAVALATAMKARRAIIESDHLHIEVGR